MLFVICFFFRLCVCVLHHFVKAFDLEFLALTEVFDAMEIFQAVLILKLLIAEERKFMKDVASFFALRLTVQLFDGG